MSLVQRCFPQPVLRSRVARTLSLVLCTAGLTLSSQASTLCVNPAGSGGCSNTISAAVALAKPHDIIRVQPGTYAEQVTITKPLSLISTQTGMARINATGKANGIFVNGMSAAPNAAFADVVISGFTIVNANFEGLLVANASNVTIFNNTVKNNDKALDINAPACPGIPAFETNEAEDCGEGIHLMAADYATVTRNEVANNSGGILITDETGMSHDNVISENYVHNNPFDCGITLASHGPAVSVIPTATLPYGLTRNTISLNASWSNGKQVPGAGAGIGIFAPFPGTTNSANLVSENDVRDNGLPGITMHNHAWDSHAPPVNMNNNRIINNTLSGNAADTEDAATGGPTGINIYSVAPIFGTVVLQNRFDNEAYDVVFKAPAGQLNAHFNDFNDAVGVANLGTGGIDASENYWHCPGGPGGGSCATMQGSGIMAAPWLNSAYVPF